VRWCRATYGIRDLPELCAPMIDIDVDHRRAQGLSPNTLGTELTALRRLDQRLRLKGLLSLALCLRRCVSREFSPGGALSGRGGRSQHRLHRAGVERDPDQPPVCAPGAHLAS
jgi:hypothetical protein